MPPSGPGEWSIRQIQEVLSRPLPAQLLSTRRQGGKEIPLSRLAYGCEDSRQVCSRLELGNLSAWG